MERQKKKMSEKLDQASQFSGVGVGGVERGNKFQAFINTINHWLLYNTAESY